MAEIKINGTAYTVPSGIRLSEALKSNIRYRYPSPAQGWGAVRNAAFMPRDS